MTMTLSEKITALLAKAERTTNEHERDSFNAKAEELMLRHGVERAELESAGQVDAEKIVRHMTRYTGGYAAVMPGFWQSIALALGNLTVIQSTGYKGRTVHLVGHESDVERAETLVTSLLVQAHSACRRWWKSSNERQYLTGWHAFKARRTFLSSFAAGAASRIRAERHVREGEASAGAELVLVSKQGAVDDWIRGEWGDLRAGRGLSGSTYGSSAGWSAGEKADVGGSRKAVDR